MNIAYDVAYRQACFLLGEAAVEKSFMTAELQRFAAEAEAAEQPSQPDPTERVEQEPQE